MMIAGQCFDRLYMRFGDSNIASWDVPARDKGITVQLEIIRGALQSLLTRKVE